MAKPSNKSIAVGLGIGILILIGFLIWGKGDQEVVGIPDPIELEEQLDPSGEALPDTAGRRGAMAGRD